MDKTYNAQAIEKHWRQHWEQSGYFQPSGRGKAYSIALPPPNVTGSLHMGHGFQMTLMDILVRYKRMAGYNTLWQAGTDHAGIATQMVVERQLAACGQSRQQLGREAFNQKVWEWRDTSGGTITQQMRRLGVSVDWSRECFSLDPHIAEAVYTTFDKLYQDGLLYRGQRLVNWDTKFQTAISDLEVINKPASGHLWHIKYQLAEQDSFLVVATTRPETLFGDVAVAVHPEDKRYRHLIGSHLRLPLTERTIPIIADDMVDLEFGSGCVKITPGHDFNDYAVGQRHNLPIINIFDKSAHLNTQAPAPFQGMERFAARKLVVEHLNAQGLIEKIEEHQHTLPYGDRSDTIIEPLCTNQWFIKMESLAQPAIAALEKRELVFYPDNWKNTYLRWLEEIQDWCVSRQLWWGHQIPAWYDEQNNIYIARSADEARERYSLAADTTLTQDPDVLDTWFSAALWPFATLGWPDTNDILDNFYPTNTLVTGFDIIFFWVARMVMLGYYCTGHCPFKEVYITGLIRDHQGQKMSKSKGNVLDPTDIIDGIDLEQLISKRTANMMQPKKAQAISSATAKQFPQGIPDFGTDALRFTFCALASTGRDINFDLERITGYRNFCNKLWNASRYVLMQTESKTLAKDIMPQHFTLAEHWILDKLHHLTCAVEQHLAQYRFDLMAQALYDFVWNQYCDWYIELCKVNLQKHINHADTTQQIYTMLIYVLETTLRLLHPIMPFITEEIWQKVATLQHKTHSSIMLQPFPNAAELPTAELATANMQQLQNMISAIRTIRSEMQVKPNVKINLLLQSQHAASIENINNQSHHLQALAKIDTINWLEQADPSEQVATAALEHITIYVPLAGIIDLQAEKARLKKNLDTICKDLCRCEHKLNNPNYISKAPAEVVAAEQQKKDDLCSKRDRLQLQLKQLDANS